MKVNFAVSVVLLCAGFGAMPLAGQEPSKWPGERGVFASAGVGLGSNDVGALVSLTYRHKSLLFGARVSATGSSDFFPPASQVFDRDVALLVGRQFVGRAGYASVSTGLAVAHGERPGAPRTDCPASFVGALFCGNEVVERRTLGLPVEGKLVLSTRYAGIGVSAFGNLNSHASFFGLALVLELGAIR